MNEFKNNLRKMFAGNNVQPRELSAIPTTISMPEGRYYTPEELRDLYKQFGKYERDREQPFNEYYGGAPQYIFSAPQWLINRDDYTPHGQAGINVYPQVPGYSGPFVIRAGIRPY